MYLRYSFSSLHLEPEHQRQCFYSDPIPYENSSRHSIYSTSGMEIQSDTKSFDEICKSNPYPGRKITKVECIGHMQKRVGARLRKIKSNYIGKTFQMIRRLEAKED